VNQDDANLPGMIGRHPAMIEVYRRARLAARSSLPVLIVGETGTGKELVARAIHEGSAAARGPFIDVNCAALPETLAEAELFGVERGAYTGAVRPVPGLIEVANGGTLMLDEACSLPAAIQAKLLRVIEQLEFRRVGGRQRRQSRFRLITVISRPMGELVRDGILRPDFAHRVAGSAVILPPLRERASDIELLANHFLVHANGGALPKKLMPEAAGLLRMYRWPGNVRELKMFIERLAGADGDMIDVTSVVLELPGAESDHDPGHVAVVLAGTGWVVARAARMLGIHRATLYRRMRELGIARPPRCGSVARDALSVACDT